jgi:putative hydrolase of the HAD superfamily
MHRAGAVAAAALWPQADPERSQRAGIRFRDDPEGHFGAYTRGEVEFAEMRRARIAELATWLDQGVDDDLWDAFEAAYEPAFLRALAAFDDVVPTIEALRARGCVVGVLTNSSGGYTTRKLAAAGLDGLFDVVCSTDTLGYGKPDPRAFHEACRLLGTAPALTAYVGDELRTDPLGAADAGMPAAWLVRDATPDPSGRRLVAARGLPVVAGLGDVLALVSGDLGAGERTGSIFPRFA